MKNGKIIGRILSALFALILTFSLCAVAIYADEELSAADAAEAVELAETADEAEADAEEEGAKTFFKPLNFIKNLQYMGVGMLCIIIVMGVLIGVTVLLNKVTAPKKK